MWMKREAMKRGVFKIKSHDISALERSGSLDNLPGETKVLFLRTWHRKNVGDMAQNDPAG